MKNKIFKDLFNFPKLKCPSNLETGSEFRMQIRILPYQVDESWVHASGSTLVQFFFQFEFVFVGDPGFIDRNPDIPINSSMKDFSSGKKICSH
jgi:hypothetical protein